MQDKANDTLDRNNQHEQNMQQLLVSGMQYHINEAKKLITAFEKGSGGGRDTPKHD